MRFLAALLLALLLAGGARAQDTALTVATCGTLPLAYNPGSQNFLTQDATGKLCANVSVTATANTTVAAQSTLPTLSAGTQTPTASLAGAAYTQSVFGSASGGGTQVDATHGLPVNIIAGGTSPASVGATGAAVPASADYIAGNLGGNLTGLTLTANGLKVDGSAVTQPVSAASLPLPAGAAAAGCAGQTIANTSVKPISLTAGAAIVSGVAAKKVYICALDLVVSAADNVALVEGTTVTTPCDTGTAGMAGGTTAATGWNLAANGGLTKGNGQGLLYVTATAADSVCLLVSGAAQVSGAITYAQF